MSKGKQTCKILKEIRKQIAEENDIELITSECTHKGDCKGTCPKCEAEVRYLERELEKRQRLGKAVVFAGMTLGTAMTAASCGPLVQPTAGMPMDPNDTVVAMDTVRNDSVDEPYLLEGEVLAPEPDSLEKEKKAGCKSDELSAIVGDVDDEEGWTTTEGYIVPWTDDSDEPEVYMIVDEMPEFPGGDDKLMRFIADQTKYPQEAKEKGVEGRVFVSFIVEPDGSITDIKVLLPSIGNGCDEEAIRVVESMPKWEPGKLNGEIVRVRYQVPVYFKLDNTQE